MALENCLKSDYGTQHFGFHPRGFFDKIYNGFYESIFEALTQMKQHLIEEYSKDGVSANIIEVNTEALFQELVKRLDIAIDRLEIFIGDYVFNIPEDLVFPEDEIHITHPCTVQEDKALDKELEDLKQKILEERTRRNVLKAKIAEQKFLEKELVIFKNKLQQILTVVVQSSSTKEDLRVTMEKCMKLSETLKHNLKLH